MKNVLIGIAAGVAIGYVVRRLVEEGKIPCLCGGHCNCHDISELADKTKKKIKDAVDVGINQAEYVADRVEHMTNKSKKNQE